MPGRRLGHLRHLTLEPDQAQAIEAAASQADHVGDAIRLVPRAGHECNLAHLRRNRAVWRGVVMNGTMASAMAEVTEGAPIAKDAIDPELVRLSRPRPKIGVITAAGLVFLCGFFLIRLQADRRFAG